MKKRDFAYLGVIGVMSFLLYRSYKKNRSCDNLINSLPEGYTFNDPKGITINPRIKL